MLQYLLYLQSYTDQDLSRIPVCVNEVEREVTGKFKFNSRASATTSIMSSETSSPPDPEFLAAAAQRRNVTTGQSIPSAELLRQHDQRQKFRRLINPGISRPNSQEAAMASLKVCSGCINYRI
jgi:hypothetical protein